jgi:hypothetical protein
MIAVSAVTRRVVSPLWVTRRGELMFHRMGAACWIHRLGMKLLRLRFFFSLGVSYWVWRLF